MPKSASESVPQVPLRMVAGVNLMTPLHTPTPAETVRTRVVLAILTCACSCRHPTAFLLYANGRPTTDLDKLGHLVQGEADKLVNDGPTAKELNRVKKVIAVTPRCQCQVVTVSHLPACTAGFQIIYGKPIQLRHGGLAH